MLYGAVLLWVNLYIGRDLFFAEYTGHSNSVHGLWMSMARLAGEHWFRPSWWPYFDGGIPFEHAYMPLIPALTAVSAKLSGASVAHAFNMITGLAYCLGPLALFAMAFVLTRSPGYSFWAALFYSLTSTARAIVWDDTPLEVSLTLLTLAVLFMWLSLTSRKRTN